MSDNKTLKSVTDQHSCLSESATSITDNAKSGTEIENSVSLTKEQDTPIQDTECSMLCNAESGISDMPIKEINQTVVVEDAEVAYETSLAEKETKDSVTITKQNEQSPNVQQTSIAPEILASFSLQYKMRITMLRRWKRKYRLSQRSNRLN